MAICTPCSICKDRIPGVVRIEKGLPDFAQSVYIVFCITMTINTGISGRCPVTPPDAAIGNVGTVLQNDGDDTCGGKI